MLMLPVYLSLFPHRSYTYTCLFHTPGPPPMNPETTNKKENQRAFLLSGEDSLEKPDPYFLFATFI